MSGMERTPLAGLSPYYRPDPGVTIAQTESVDFPRLLDELGRRPELEDVVRDGFYVARLFGDKALLAIDRSGNVQQLLGEVYPHSTPRRTTLLDTHPYGAGYDPNRHLIVSDEEIVRIAEQIAGRAEANNIRLRPGDNLLFAPLTLVAHEAAHGILFGISRLLGDKLGGAYKDYTRLAARSYLGNHPGYAFTGHWPTDYAIFEERFAEGYALQAMHQAYLAAGYSEKEARILSARSFKTDITGKPGQNQIDHLGRKHKHVSPVELVKENKGDDIQTYPGELGYEAPLSCKQLVGVLSELGKTLHGEQPIIDQNPETWAARVKWRQSIASRWHNMVIRGRRYDALNPDNTRGLRALTIARRVLAATVSLQMLGLIAPIKAEQPATPTHVIRPSLQKLLELTAPGQYIAQVDESPRPSLLPKRHFVE